LAGLAPGFSGWRCPLAVYIYKVVGYLDDLKPAIVDRVEFTIVDKAIKLFEGTSGCSLHRDPLSLKCQFLTLGKWKNWKEADCLLPYLNIIR
jgi:hypothetical protein